MNILFFGMMIIKRSELDMILKVKNYFYKFWQSGFSINGRLCLKTSGHF